MEMFDVVDEFGQPTGEVVERKQAHAMGIRHRTAHIWVVRKKEGRTEVLLQKRSADKDSFPGCYDTSAAGHIQAGDDVKTSALRELSEELGIEAREDQLNDVGCFVIQFEASFHGSIFKDEEIAFVHIYTEPVEIEKLKLQKEEVDEVSWFDIDMVINAIEMKESWVCVPKGGLMLVKDWCSEHFE